MVFRFACLLLLITILAPSEAMLMEHCNSSRIHGGCRRFCYQSEAMTKEVVTAVFEERRAAWLAYDQAMQAEQQRVIYETQQLLTTLKRLRYQLAIDNISASRPLIVHAREWLTKYRNSLEYCDARCEPLQSQNITIVRSQEHLMCELSHHQPTKDELSIVPIATAFIGALFVTLVYK